MTQRRRPFIDHMLTTDHLYVRYGRGDTQTAKDLATYDFGTLTVSAAELFAAGKLCAAWHAGVNTGLCRFSQGHWDYETVRTAMAELSAMVADAEQGGSEPWAAKQALALLTRICTFDFGGPGGKHDA